MRMLAAEAKAAMDSRTIASVEEGASVDAGREPAAGTDIGGGLSRWPAQKKDLSMPQR